MNRRLGLGEQARELGVIQGGRMLGRKFGCERLNRALRVHDLGRAHAGEVELHGERLGEQPRVAARNAGAAALALLIAAMPSRFQVRSASPATMPPAPKRAPRSLSV